MPVVRRTVTLDPHCDRLIKRVQLELMRHRLPKTNYSHALHTLIAGLFYMNLCYMKHHPVEIPDEETIQKLIVAAKSKCNLSAEDYQAFENALEGLVRKIDSRTRELPKKTDDTLERCLGNRY